MGRGKRPNGTTHGMEPMVLLTDQPLEPETLRLRVEHETLGGVVVFCGEVRSQTGEERTEHIDYESYPEMALKQMHSICEAAVAKWGGRVAVAHRTGRLLPGEIAVVTAAACAHRAEAFDCCRYLIDQIKADVPIWKGGEEQRAESVERRP